MNELPSTEFRKQFARLTEATLVTVNGHPIGTWTPHRISEEFVAAILAEPPAGHIRVPAHLDPTLPKFTQAQRDELLRKINRGGK